ncbi:AAA family ATPase [Lapillicoccus jejuensis]|uniref:Putative kinase n=1 Tax=Lapillicoccus jejuensis TaxID=402171 RepID=A0A542DZ48_9MICO|nr:ATP-binding protein [Lapillicoccus jejuensis]TQJ08326.1 putative kinase [Lapillicoccus jejuensis]
MTTLTLFCGLPGAGKTTLATRLEAQGLGVRLCTDEWQGALGRGHDDTELHERLQRRLYEHALTLLRHGVDVILEDGLWTAPERAEKLEDARACGARVELHVFDMPYDVLRRRLADRLAASRPGDHPVTEDGLARAWDLFQPPSPDELALVDAVRRHGGGWR